MCDSFDRIQERAPLRLLWPQLRGAVLHSSVVRVEGISFIFGRLCSIM
jgi:hypothetical protein